MSYLKTFQDISSSNSSSLSLVDPLDIPSSSPGIFLSKLLLSNLNLSVYSFSDEQKQWIIDFISNSPASFEKITMDIQSIVDDNAIQINDIPKIVKLLADIYNNESIQKGVSNPAMILVFIKYTLDNLLNSKLIHLSDIEINTIESIINISIDLLNTNLEPMNTTVHLGKSSNCFFWFFTQSKK
jgi:hypothetical protein